MLPTEDPHPLLHEAGDAEIARYRPLSKLAVAGLIVGLLSPLAVIEPVLYLIPLAGILVGALALGRIARSGQALLGRKAALAGLVLSVGLAAAAPGHWITYRWLLRREARQFATVWFDLLRQGEPQKAFQLTVHPDYRQPLDDSLWDYYKENPQQHRSLWDYVGNAERGLSDQAPPLVRTLLALGSRARVRYFATEGQGRIGGTDTVYQIYAVTYDEGGGPKTFFVSMELKRVLVKPSGVASWRITRADGGVRPSAYGGKEEDAG